MNSLPVNPDLPRLVTGLRRINLSPSPPSGRYIRHAYPECGRGPEGSPHEQGNFRNGRGVFRLLLGKVRVPPPHQDKSPRRGAGLPLHARLVLVRGRISRDNEEGRGEFRNYARGIPTVYASVLLADGATGETMALLEGGSLTAIRTGAASGLATRLLSRPDSSVLALFGAGKQARTQALAVCSVRPIQEVRIYSPHKDHVTQFINDCRGKNPLPEKIVPASSPGDALSGADIVCTATTSGTPVFSDRDLEEGVHINAVGAYLPDTAEIPPKTVGRARVYVDSRAAAFSEAGDLILPLRQGIIREEHVLGELGELVLGTIPGRERPDEVTLFKSLGIAVQDAAAAWECYRNAVRLGIGMDIEW
jgi:alanine dehydrogenase